MFCDFLQNAPDQQINAAGVASYGSVEQHVPGNPFAMAAEAVQPEARDTYLHGGIEERNY